MTLKEEMEKAAAEGIDFIPPYKLNVIMQYAGKVVKMLTENSSAVTIGYTDMKTILRIVEHTIDQGYSTERGEADEPR